MKTISFFSKMLLLAILLAPISASAQVSIGSGDIPQATLDIRGNPNETGKAFRLIDGNQAPGKVLTVGENGIATWQETQIPATTTRIIDIGLSSGGTSLPIILEAGRVYLVRISPGAGTTIGDAPQGSLLIESFDADGINPALVNIRSFQAGGRNFSGGNFTSTNVIWRRNS